MHCVICKVGETQKGKVSFTVERNGSFLVFSKVDAELCDNCGEAYLDSETAKAFNKKLGKNLKKAAK